MASISALLAKIFKAYGYNIVRNTEHSQYILANKDNINLAIGYQKGGAVPLKKDLRNFIKTARSDEAHRSIYVAMEDLDYDLEQILKGQNVEVWEREKFEKELGRALLGDIAELSGESDSDSRSIINASSEPAVSDVTERQEIMVPFVLGEVPTTIQGEKATETIDTGLNIMPPKISREVAESLTKRIVKSYRFDLQLIPYFIFDFSCEIVEGPNRETRINRGTLGINTLSNHIEEWPENFETVSQIDQEFTKLDPAFTVEEAEMRIRDAVVELNTMELETIEDKGTAIIIEKKKIRPKEDVMKIDSRGMVYMPVWCVEGSNGLITVDATSGKVIKEDIFKDKNVSFL